MLPHCEISKMDNRWTDAAYKTFVTYLNDFYRKSNFRNFYVRHSYLYNLAVKKVNQVLGTLHTRWFKSLFGVELGSPLIIVSLTNGRDNYGFTREIAGEKLTGIVVGCVSDSIGLPTCRFDMDYIVIHELLHNYTNPLILQNWDPLSLSAEKIYSSINDELYLGSYDHPQAMTFEWFAKLLSLMYYRDNPQSDKPLKAAIKNMQNQGFIWMERSMMFMEHFYKNRDRYPYLKDYMGQIIGFMKYTSDNMEYVLKEYNARAPYIVETYPVNGSIVSEKVDTIEIRFSEAMLGAYGNIKIKEEDIKELPVKGECLWKDDRTFIIPVDTSKLEQGKYGIRLNPRGFQSLKRYLIKDAYTYIIHIANNEKF